MIRLFSHYVPRSFLLLGLVEFSVCALAVFVGAYAYNDWVYGEYAPHIPGVVESASFAVVTFVAMMAVGLYQRRLREGLEGQLLRLAAAFVLAMVVLGQLYYAFPGLAVSRGVFLTVELLAFFTVFGVRLVFFKLVIPNEVLRRRVLVLGAGKRAQMVAGLDGEGEFAGYKLVGFVALPEEQPSVPADQMVTLERPLHEVATAMQVDEIVVAAEDRRRALPVAEILESKMAGVAVLDILSFFERECGRVKLDVLQPSWLIYSEGFRQSMVRAAVKRLFDLLVCALFLLFGWPFALLTALAVWLESGLRGPVIYRQRRVGENGREFTLYKFRSMRSDAEGDGVARWAKKDDDRVTRVGRVIRKLRLDEWPQIYNVLHGDMSFVGPRPERPEFVANLHERSRWYQERHRVKPGITGWAQVYFPYGSSEEDALKKLEYDLFYVKNYSLFLDLVILIHTVEVVLWRRGAH